MVYYLAIKGEKHSLLCHVNVFQNNYIIYTFDSSTLAWKIPWTEEPGRLQFLGSLESDTIEQLHFHFSLSCIGEGNGNPLQCSCLENPRDRGAWWAAVYGFAQSDTIEATKQQQQQRYIYQRMEPISKTLFGIYIAEVFMQFHKDYIYDVHCSIFFPSS